MEYEAGPQVATVSKTWPHPQVGAGVVSFLFFCFFFNAYSTQSVVLV